MIKWFSNKSLTFLIISATLLFYIVVMIPIVKDDVIRYSTQIIGKIEVEYEDYSSSRLIKQKQELSKERERQIVEQAHLKELERLKKVKTERQKRWDWAFKKAKQLRMKRLKELGEENGIHRKSRLPTL